MRRLDKKVMEQRNEIIMKLRTQGLTMKQIAAQVNLSESAVITIVAKARKKIEMGK